jgi:hypothetical protein
MARRDKEVGVDTPAMRLCRGEASNPVSVYLTVTTDMELVEDGRRAQIWNAHDGSPCGYCAGDEAVILPNQCDHAHTSEFIDGHDGLLRIGRRVPDQHLERPSQDPARPVDLGHGEFKAGEKLFARINPSRPTQRGQCAD